MDNQNLENRIRELEKWKSERERQQIVFPLDTQSIRILQENFMRITEAITTVGGVAGLENTQFGGSQGQYNFIVSQNTYVSYLVNTTTDFVITNSYFEDDLLINILTTDTAPAGLTVGVDYYVINSTGETFQLTTVQGNPAFIVDITSVGVGNQYLFSVGY